MTWVRCRNLLPVDLNGGIMLKRLGIISVVVTIVAIGLVFVTQGTEAGKNVFLFANTISGPTATAIQIVDHKRKWHDASDSRPGRGIYSGWLFER
jgi:hypothetical protein